MRPSFQLRGDAEIDRALEAIPPALRDKVLPRALRSAGSRVVAHARRMVPQDTGLLRRALGMVVRRPRGKDPFAVLGARRGFKQMVTRKTPWGPSRYVPADPANYAHLVELGTRTAPAKPFLRPAFDASGAAVRAAFVKALRRALERLPVR